MGKKGKSTEEVTKKYEKSTTKYGKCTSKVRKSKQKVSEIQYVQFIENKYKKNKLWFLVGFHGFSWFQDGHSVGFSWFFMVPGWSFMVFLENISARTVSWPDDPV